MAPKVVKTAVKGADKTKAKATTKATTKAKNSLTKKNVKKLGGRQLTLKEKLAMVSNQDIHVYVLFCVLILFCNIC